MKDIIIFGCPRSGKTTLTNMLQKKLNYQIVSLDSLVYAFENNFPQIGFSKKEDFRERSKKIIPFINNYIKNYKLDYPGQCFIIEGCQIMISDILPVLDRNNVECVCLGFPSADSNDIFNQIRRNDSNMRISYSKKIADDELKRRINIWIKLSKFFKKEALQFGVPFYDTDIDREKKLNSIYNKIISNVLEKEEEK